MLYRCIFYKSFSYSSGFDGAPPGVVAQGSAYICGQMVVETGDLSEATSLTCLGGDVVSAGMAAAGGNLCPTSGLSLQLGLPHKMAAPYQGDCPDTERQPVRSTIAFYGPALECTEHLFCCMTKSSPGSRAAHQLHLLS